MRQSRSLPVEALAPPEAQLGALESTTDRIRRFLGSSVAGTVSLGVLIFVALVAIFANQLAPFDPLETDYSAIRSAPSTAHLLGTDNLGRDTLSRLIHGARITAIVALSSVALGDSLGFLWGLASGYIGRRFDTISQRLLDILMAFPTLILALLLLVSLGSGLHTVIIAIAITRVPLATRVIRSMVLSVKEMSYVEAAHSIGVRPHKIVARHIAPQCVAPLLIVVSFNLGTAIFAESALSFLGVGVPPPTPTWGSMLGGVLAEAFKPPWWLVIFPGLAITVTIIAANLFGDALRDFLDPRMKQQLE